MSKMKAANSAWHSSVRHRGAEAVAHVNIALLRKLAKLVENPFDEKEIKVGQYLVVDGTFQQADVAQWGSQNEEVNALLRGDHEGTAFMRNLADDGKVLKETNGYNVVTLFDLATSLPVISFPYPANKNERKAAEELLEMLFMIWPECPAEFLIGDALYDHSVGHASRLQFIYNMNPIFPRHGSRSDTISRFAATDGVPTCPHHPSGFKNAWETTISSWDLTVSGRDPLAAASRPIEVPGLSGSVGPESATPLGNTPDLSTIHAVRRDTRRLAKTGECSIDGRRWRAGTPGNSASP